MDKLTRGRLKGQNRFNFYKWVILSLFLGVVCPAFAQPTITIGSIDAGPYGSGSSIAVPITINDSGGNLTISNRFDLYLSDASGSFATETKIGEYSGFFTTFVNGVIPDLTAAGASYRVRVKSSAPATISAASGTFAIVPVTGVVAALTSSQTINTNPRTFGVCNNTSSIGTTSDFVFTNNSTANAAVSATFKNELNGVTSSPLVFVPPSQTFTASQAHYTVFVKAQAGAIIGTQAYFLINNRTLNSFSTSGASAVCLPAQALEYDATVSNLQNNFPGLTYRVDWGDGSAVSFYSLNKIIADGSKVSHLYTKSSCGSTVTTGQTVEHNVFGIRIQPFNSLCNSLVGGSLGFTASVVNQPENRISSPGIACITDLVTFFNTSDPGQSPNSTSAVCTNPDARYDWYINGVPVQGAQDVPVTFNLKHTFTATGRYFITIRSRNTGACTAAPRTVEICISKPPAPAFSLPGNGKLCLLTAVQPVNNTVIDANGCSTTRFSWVITGPAKVAYLNGTDSTSRTPQFQFTVAGRYTFKLVAVTDSVDANTKACKAVETTEQTVIVNGAPTAVLDADLSLCGVQTLVFNDTPGSKTRITFSGTFQEEGDTYTWSVTGGAYSFANGTNANSKYPSISFDAFANYTVTVTHTNNCGTTSDTQQIAINNAPFVSAGPDIMEVCYGPFVLNGSITGSPASLSSVQNKQWIGGSGSFSDPAILNPTYTPTQAEMDAGFVTLTLRVVTNIQAPCDTILATITVRFVRNDITSPPSKIVCNNDQVNYQPVASLSGSTFTWTISQKSEWIDRIGFPPVAGFINDMLVNTGTESGTITYLITASNPSCNSQPFTFTVTVPPPLSGNTISSSITEICSGQQVTISGSTPTGGDGSFIYRWETSADNSSWGIIPGATLKDLTLTVTTTAWFRRTVISGTCPNISDVIQIVAQPPLGSNTISSLQSVCPGVLPAALTGSTPTGGDGQYTYQWLKREGNDQTWLLIAGATAKDYQPGALTQTTHFQRVVSSTLCTGPQQNFSPEITITVYPLPEAVFTFSSDLACAPFTINSQNIKATDFPDKNSALYVWYANNVQIGTGINFPGYTISNATSSVVIKLVANSKFGCTFAEMSHTFRTIDAVNASFTQNLTQGCGPLAVQFGNTSSPVDGATYTWDFSNGQIFNGSNPGPITFQPNPNGRDSLYVIKLTATTACTSNTFTSTVLVKARPRSVFSPSATVGCAPFTVTFSNTSPSTSATYHWDFGDGSPIYSTTSKDPVSHTFTVSGNPRDFIVKMTASNECQGDVTQYTIRATPHQILPELVVNANEKEGCGPLTVRFFNNSKNASSFIYDFGDGSPTVISNTAPEVITHTFRTAGRFLVRLTAINSCSDTTTTELITVYAQPTADFSANVVKGCNNLNVTFTNRSVNGFTYLWDFGDGTTSVLANPSHVFTDAKTFYTIRLIATNLSGCRDTLVMANYINIVPVHALFDISPDAEISIPDYTFNFTDRTANNPAAWHWDFGDGSTSVQQNPSHTYADTGRYVVKLIVHNQDGCPDSLSKAVRITGVPGYLFIANSFMPGSASPELKTFKVKGSGIKEWTMRIFNKWGEVIWESNKLIDGSPSEEWDGTINGSPAPQGVYFWTVSVKMMSGIEWRGMSYDGSAPQRTGVIHLLR